MVKLNLGCGDMVMEGFTNIDLFSEDPRVVKADVMNLPYEENSVDLIYTSHLIEHFDYHEGRLFLAEMYRVLKPGSECVVETPELTNLCRRFATTPEHEQYKLYGILFGMPWVPRGAHLFLYTRGHLKAYMKDAGFIDINERMARRYISWEDICVRLHGWKSK